LISTITKLVVCRQTTSIDRDTVLILTMIVSNILHLDLAHHESVDQTRQVALTILSTQGPTMVAMFADYGVETLSALASKKDECDILP